jgi:hypothetical protein
MTLSQYQIRYYPVVPRSLVLAKQNQKKNESALGRGGRNIISCEPVAFDFVDFEKKYSCKSITYISIESFEHQLWLKILFDLDLVELLKVVSIEQTSWVDLLSSTMDW